MVKTKDEILEAIKSRIGEDNSDETIAFLEDITDTLNDYEDKTKTDTDWKAKYEENDKEWRKRYTDRFFNNDNGNGDNGDDEKGKEDEPKTPTTFDELFGEKGE